METKAGNLDGLVKTSIETSKSEGTAFTASQSDKPPTVEDAPDPDEDDLDDLDGEYNPIKQVHN